MTTDDTALQQALTVWRWPGQRNTACWGPDLWQPLFWKGHEGVLRGFVDQSKEDHSAEGVVDTRHHRVVVVGTATLPSKSNHPVGISA